MSKKFRVCMIGAGGRANDVIYPSIDDIEDVSIVGICDIDVDRLNKTADKYNVDKRYYKTVFSYQDMLNELKPDAVFVIGQPDIMYNIWVWVLENGYNLYIEKPLALTIHQARSLATLANKNNCTTAVSYQRRATPLVINMRNKCLEKGPITHAFCRFYKCMPKTPTFGSRDHMMDDCVHSIDTLRWIIGGQVTKIESVTKRVGVHDINFISATLHFDNGGIGYLINSWVSGRRIFAVEMHSEGICAEAEHEIGGKIYENSDTQGVLYCSKTEANSDKDFIYTGVKNLVEEFINCCKTKTSPQTNFNDAVKTMEIAEKILAQSLLSE